MPPSPKSPPSPPALKPSAQADTPWPRLASLCMGLTLGLAFLKLGNPVILDYLVEPPANALEFIFQAWPVAWGYGLLLLVILSSLKAFQPQRRLPLGLFILPALWFAWQIVAASTSIDSSLTRATLFHFAACAAWFYLGHTVLGPIPYPRAFWIPLLIAFLWILWTGFEQHFGGLEATRKMFYQQPDWEKFPPEYLQKISSNRIFSTLVYPNAFAGAVLLLLPPLLLACWRASARLSIPSRAVICGSMAAAALACLFWSGSKAGWLIALTLALIAILQLPFLHRWRWAIVLVLLTLGLSGFYLRYAAYFQKGATSVVARIVYWEAAWATFLDRPLLGSGPGTFARAYSKIKPEGAEMAKLAHNDYLQQASDSGFIGFAAYSTFIFGSLFLLYRYRKTDPFHFAVWLGLCGATLQGFVEFGLYIPALAWTTFALFGWLSAQTPSPPPVSR